MPTRARKRLCFDLFAVVLALTLFFSLTACKITGSHVAPPNTALSVHFIDVGQGDCALIETQGHYMLIDGGERGSEAAVIKYLKRLKVQRLDYVVATHPHSDHIGGLAYGVLEEFPVGTIIAPKLSQQNTPTTETYLKLMQVVYALTKQGTKAEYAKPDMVYALGAAAFTILGPLSEDIENHNNNSVVLRVVYQNSAALFTGDAEIQAENALVEQYGAGLQAGLLKAGHHGSKTSSSDAFLRAVRPDYITICCGIGNTYGHPHKQTLRQCKQLGIKVRRTDINGNIVFDTDGTVWVPRD